MSTRRQPATPAYPRVLLCTADVGCGHARAAAAILYALRRLRPDIRPHIAEALSGAPAWFNYLYRDTYLATVRHLPRFTGWLYNRSDVPGTPPHRGAASAIESVALRSFCAGEQIAAADLIITTHFLCARVLSRLIENGQITAKLAVVVTDQHPHAVWRVPHADLSLVPSEQAAKEMVRNGVDRRRVTVTGIPIDARFDAPLSQLQARVRHNLARHEPIVLLTGGGLGLGGIEPALHGLLSARNRAFALVVCGRNRALYDRLSQRYKTGFDDRCRIIGLSTKMHELMAAADLLLGKPGGLTTAEAIARRLPMVLLRPIPGQEERNAQMLVDAGAAVRVDDPLLAGQTSASLLTDAPRLAAMRQSVQRLHHPHSSAAVAEASLALCADQPDRTESLTEPPHRPIPRTALPAIH